MTRERPSGWSGKLDLTGPKPFTSTRSGMTMRRNWCRTQRSHCELLEEMYVAFYYPRSWGSGECKPSQWLFSLELVEPIKISDYPIDPPVTRIEFLTLWRGARLFPRWLPPHDTESSPSSALEWMRAISSGLSLLTEDCKALNTTLSDIDRYRYVKEFDVRSLRFNAGRGEGIYTIVCVWANISHAWGQWEGYLHQRIEIMESPIRASDQSASLTRTYRALLITHCNSPRWRLGSSYVL